MRFHRFRAIACAGLLLATLAAYGDVVKLSGHRALRTTGITVDGNHAVLAIRDGGSITVPLAEIESITAEPVAAALCAASPFRCQDRSMLLGRRAQAQAIHSALSPKDSSRAHTP